MQLNSETLDNNIIKITLSGRMDLLGIQAIDLKFTTLTTSHKVLVLVDMSEVSFLASLGIRTLLSSAKAAKMRGGYLVIYHPQANVLDVLNASGVARLIPIYDDHQQAIDALLNH